MKPLRGALIDRAHPLARFLEGGWMLNEGPGSSWGFDFSGRNNKLTLGGGMSPADDWKAGPNGYVIDFDGAANLATAPYLPSYAAGQGYTFAYSFKTTVNYSGTYGSPIINVHAGTLILFGFGNGPGGIGAPNTPFVSHVVGGGSSATSTKTGLNDGLWHVVVGGRTASGRAFISVDNEPIVMGVVDSGEIVSTLLVVGLTFAFQLGFVYVWGRALSQAEVGMLNYDNFCLVSRASIKKQTPAAFGDFTLPGTVRADTVLRSQISNSVFSVDGYHFRWINNGLYEYGTGMHRYMLSDNVFTLI